MAARAAGPILGRALGASATRTFTTTGASPGPVTHMLFGVACGALAVCGVQFLMVILSEIELNRSVDAISE